MHFPFDHDLSPPLCERAIFAVSEDEHDRASFLQTLREAKVEHPCRIFSTGDEMIEALIEVLKGAPLPLLCFIDMKMPDMGGVEVLRWIRLQDALAEVAIVMLSSDEDSATLKECLRLGAQCHAKKLPDGTQLRAIVDEAKKFSAFSAGRPTFDLDGAIEGQR